MMRLIPISAYHIAMKRIILHGGCGAREDRYTSFETYHQHLQPIIRQAYAYLEQHNDAVNAAVFAARLLEDDPLFNAGTGSRVQQDGQIRMSASIMDSRRRKFAGVINIQNVQNPIDIADRLTAQHHSVLGGEPATHYAHKTLGVPAYNPMTESRWQEYLECRAGQTGTIGVVVLDDQGTICAATSTGGAGFELPGRIGDSPTVAGNFASACSGVACTGIGEHILNNATAARVDTRIQAGMQLDDTVAQTIEESNVSGDYVGLIALDAAGNIQAGSTDIAQTLYAYCDGARTRTFVDEL